MHLRRLSRLGQSELPIVGFIGMSHLGLVTSTTLSSLGVQTICFDNSSEKILQLQNRKTEILEPGLLDLLQKTKVSQNFVTNLNELRVCNVIYISYDVPTDSLGESNLSIIYETMEILNSNVLQAEALVILSQVPPGFTRRLQSLSKIKIYYQVETLVFGEAISRSRNPERIIIGSPDSSVEIVSSLGAILELYECPILHLSLESAELAKVSINAYLASDVILSNSLADLADSIGAKWSEIIPALRLDRRIGSYRYLTPGLGITGGNLERDLKTLEDICLENGLSSQLFSNMILENYKDRHWALQKLHKVKSTGMEPFVIGILGLTYKPNTNAIKNSASIETIKNIPKNWRIIAHDPCLESLEMPELHRMIELRENPLEIIEEVNILMILTPWKMYRELINKETLMMLQSKTIIDPFMIISDVECKDYGITRYSKGQSYKYIGETD